MPGHLPLTSCPVPHVHRRLMDCHEHWHAALDQYMDPNGFRLNLNSLVQALRNVTWLLQKQKNELPDFATWYPEWQTSVKGDPVMSWVVKARNRIVKESDLELNSTARLIVALDWVHGGEKVFSVPPRWTPLDIAQMLARKGLRSDIKEGLSSLTIERRWVDRLLPDRELLAACAYAYGHLTSVVATAHDRSGLEEGCDLEARTRECVDASLEFPLDCMWAEEDVRSAHFDYATLAPYRSEKQTIHLDPELAAVARDRYGVSEPLAGDAIQRVPRILELGKKALSADGFIVTTAWLLRGEEVVDMQVPVFSDQAGKMLAMHNLATRVEMLNADGFGMLSEVWNAPVPSAQEFRSGHYVRATDHPDRTEGIHAFGVTKAGGFLSIVAPFSRDENNAVVLGDSEAQTEPSVLMLVRPVLRVWGVEDPQPMRDALEALERDEGDPADSDSGVI